MSVGTESTLPQLVHTAAAQFGELSANIEATSSPEALIAHLQEARRSVIAQLPSERNERLEEKLTHDVEKLTAWIYKVRVAFNLPI